jgi:hypothetical protein
MMLERYTSTTATWQACYHKNGWYNNVGFWIFKKRVFCCHDCERIIQDYELRMMEADNEAKKD